MPRDPTDPRRIVRVVLPVGLTVARQAAPAGSQSFSASYMGPGGWAYDPVGREGTALATTQLLPSGAGPWDRVALDRHLDRMGATLARRCHPESSEVTVWGPRSLWSRLLDVLAAVVQEPHLREVDLRRVRRQMVERLLREATQPESRADRELALSVFPLHHPYRLSGLGQKASLARLTRDDVVRFHARQYTSSGGFVVATGGPPLSALAREVGRRFSGLAQRAPAPPTLPSPRDLKGAAPHRLHLPGHSQVEIRIGGVSLPRSSPKYPGAYLANEVLGGRPLLSRLFQTVRERHGLAYHASSELEAMRWGGYWVAGAGTGPERVDATVRLLRQELRRMVDSDVPRSELDQLRESAIGELPLGLETTSGAHELALDIAYHGLPDDFLETWPATIRALTPRDVRRAAAEAMDPESAVTVIAGPGT